MPEAEKYLTITVEEDGRNGIDSNMTPEEIFFWAGVAQQIVLNRSFEQVEE